MEAITRATRSNLAAKTGAYLIKARDKSNNLNPNIYEDTIIFIIVLFYDQFLCKLNC